MPGTAVRLPMPASDADILNVAGDWVLAVARQDYDLAFGMTAQDPYYGWSPELIGQVIEGYGLPDPHPDGPFQVTDPKSATGRSAPRREVG